MRRPGHALTSRRAFSIVFGSMPRAPKLPDAARYPALREDHLRYLRTLGLIGPADPAPSGGGYDFAALAVLRHVNAALQAGQRFRAVVRELQAARTGQLRLDFRLDASPARIATLPRRGPRPVETVPAVVPAPQPRSTAEERFLSASALDDGTPAQQEAAARLYQQALHDDPDLVPALINLANIRYARDEVAEAQALYERAVVLDPEYFEAHFNLGNIHHDRRRFADAEACYREAIALNPRYADAHFYLAVTLEKLRRSADARPHWHAYRQLSPDGAWADLAAEFCEEPVGR